VQDADDAIDLTLVDRQTRVLALTELFQHLVPVVVHVDATISVRGTMMVLHPWHSRDPGC